MKHIYKASVEKTLCGISRMRFKSRRNLVTSYKEINCPTCIGKLVKTRQDQINKLMGQYTSKPSEKRAFLAELRGL